MNKYTLIANSGIHVVSTIIEIDTRNKFDMWFHEWFNTSVAQWTLDIVQDIYTENERYFYKKKELYDKKYLNDLENVDFDISKLEDEGISPLKVNEEMLCGGNIYKMSFTARDNTLSAFENKWLPIPYFLRTSASSFKFGPFNWSRFKLNRIKSSNKSILRYNVLLAFDTRTGDSPTTYNEHPFFPHNFTGKIDFDICDDDFLLMDFCSPSKQCEYINQYLFNLVYPDISSAGRIKVGNKLNYIASYILLIKYLSENQLLPSVVIYKDYHVPVKEVDMVIDIGNSRTTALLVEDNSNFNQVEQLQLIDYTSMIDSGNQEEENGYRIYQEPFDMRLAFRKVSFGDFGIQESKQFVYPSFVRLGKEANFLMHKAAEKDSGQEKLSSLSSPKRYLWDHYKSKEEWKFIVLENEPDQQILNIPGISEFLEKDGKLVRKGVVGGTSYHYSRRSLMTFSFLEMLVQANTHINDHLYRKNRGNLNSPRKIKRIIVTCPTAMSKVEREALVKCADEAACLFVEFYQTYGKIEIIPSAPSFKDDDNKWFYDEATCSQLVYIYGEAGFKYKKSCQEFFNIYGKVEKDNDQAELTIGSLDIGAGTSDLMICKYSYTDNDVTTITPDPLFYDSFYYAGDDMLNDLIKQVMFYSDDSAFKKGLNQLSDISYRQKLRDFFGPDYSGQTINNRQLRRDFNLQYSVPLMYYFLDLLSKDSSGCIVSFEDVFVDTQPNKRVLEGFYEFFNLKLEELTWEYNPRAISQSVTNSFEPLLKKIATLMYSYRCDVVLLSGRPSSLAPIRNIFLKYYTVSPNRLILLNNYYVGHWYPFSNNTGEISNSKTVVAIGALLGCYAAEYSNLDNFYIDKSKLDSNLKSVVNYIEASRKDSKIEYLITPDQPVGKLTITSLPTQLNVQQLGFYSYPSRKLYSIDFNEYSILSGIKKKFSKEGMHVSDSQIIEELQNKTNEYRHKMPLSLTIERDVKIRKNLPYQAFEIRMTMNYLAIY